MKKILLALICAIALLNSTNIAKAQSGDDFNPNRISISWGDNSWYTAAMNVGGGIWIKMIDNKFENFNTIGTFTLSYNRVINNERWAFGLDLGYSSMQATYKDGKTDNVSLFNVAPTATCYYKKSGIFRLYGSASVGAMFDNSSDISPSFTFHFSPIGMRIGNNAIAGFLDLGYGFKGIINVGLQVGF